jgi:signal transduction histidine kinase
MRIMSVTLPMHATVFTLLSKPDTGFWIGSDIGVWKWDGQHIRSVPGLSGLSVRSLLRDRDGSIWIGTANKGLLRWRPSAGSRTLIETGVSDKSIVTLAQDHTGAIWAGSFNGGGLYRLADGKVQHFGQDEGLQSTVIYSIYVDKNYELWIGSAGGLSWFQGGRIRTVNSQHGLPSDQVFAIVEDSFGRIWLEGYATISAIDKANLYEWAVGVRHKLEPILYPFPHQGFEAGSITQFTPNTARSADGHLWFGGIGGLCEVTPSDPAASLSSRFSVLIEDITIDGIAHSESSRIRVTPGARSIELRYTALTLSNPEAVRFRYRLDGFDPDWVDVGTRRFAFYNNLKPGVYKFRVAASTDQKQWQESSTRVLDQLPFFYQTWWFALLASAMAFSLLVFAYRLRVRHAVNRVQMGFQQRLDERTRIARDLHDTLLQSFQGAVIQFQASRNLLLRGSDNAMQVVDGAIQAAEDGIAEGCAAIQQLRAEPSTLRELPELLKATGNELVDTNRWTAHTPNFSLIVEGKQRDLSPMFRDEIYRISREAIRNAFAHAAASHIEVEIRYDQDQLRVRIRDDGKGIEPKILKAGGRPGHWGIRGMCERTRQIGARLDFWSEVGAGAEIQLTVPAAIAYKCRMDSRLRLLGRSGRHERHS